jgi:AraC-like DNA-binding protein
MEFAALHPYVYYATRYPFSKNQTSRSRICYSSSLYLISEGKGFLTTRGNNYETTPGSLVYIPAGQQHEWISDRDDPMVHVCCYFDWAYSNRQAEFGHSHFICYDEAKLLPAHIGPAFPYPIPEHVKVEKLWIWIEQFEKFYTANESTNEKTYLRNLKVQGHFQACIEYFLSYVLKDEHIPNPRINKLLKQLDQDLLHGRLMPLETYYRQLRISRGYFFALFNQATGLSPIQYINHYRINRAKEDLQFTTLSITEIAEKHHFASIHYFSKLFRQLTGRTPREFRESGN